MTNSLKLQSRNYHEGMSLQIFILFATTCCFIVEKVTIPKTLQKRISKDFHMGHPGTNRMKSLMRSFVYWPSVDQYITNMAKTKKVVPWLRRHRPLLTNPGLNPNNHGPEFIYILRWTIRGFLLFNNDRELF